MRAALAVCGLSTAAPRRAARAQPPGAPAPAIFNSGPTVYSVTLHGVVTDARARAARADSVVVLPETPDCRDGGLFRRSGDPYRTLTRAAVGPDGAFALPLTTQSPRPCLRVAAVRRSGRGPATELRIGGLAPRYHGAPGLPPDSAGVPVTAPP